MVWEAPQVPSHSASRTRGTGTRHGGGGGPVSPGMGLDAAARYVTPPRGAGGRNCPGGESALPRLSSSTKVSCQ